MQSTMTGPSTLAVLLQTSYERQQQPSWQLAQLCAKHFGSPHIDTRNDEAEIVHDFLDEVSPRTHPRARLGAVRIPASHSFDRERASW